MEIQKMTYLLLLSYMLFICTTIICTTNSNNTNVHSVSIIKTVENIVQVKVEG